MLAAAAVFGRGALLEAGELPLRELPIHQGLALVGEKREKGAGVIRLQPARPGRERFDLAAPGAPFPRQRRARLQRAEVRETAAEMLWIFKAQGVHREALAALRLFCEAAKQETATVALARQVGSGSRERLSTTWAETSTCGRHWQRQPHAGRIRRPAATLSQAVGNS